MNHILVFDTETTGLPKNYQLPATDVDNWPRMVQIAWIVFDAKGQQLSEFQAIIKPDGYAIPDDAARIHGITTERAAAEGRAISEVVGLFMEEIPKVALLVAHNMGFDRRILGAEMVRLGKPPLGGAYDFYCTKERGVDICKIPGQYGYKWPKLEELHRHLFGCGVEGAHDAMNDARACARAYWRMVEPKPA